MQSTTELLNKMYNVEIKTEKKVFIVIFTPLSRHNLRIHLNHFIFTEYNDVRV